MEGEACRQLAQRAFADVGVQLEAARTRHERNRLLRATVETWSEPASLASLLLLFGCDASQSYDEFFSCTLVPEPQSYVSLDVNVYQRNIQPMGSAWECTTCTFHRHTRWWASHTVAGTIVHTMAQPTCPRADESSPTRAVPMFAALDANLSAATHLGTAIDVEGSRWRLPGHHSVWTTTEVLPIHAGTTVLFSPNWYHRVIPPTADASHSAMTLLHGARSTAALLIGRTTNVARKHLRDVACQVLLDSYRLAATQP